MTKNASGSPPSAIARDRRTAQDFYNQNPKEFDIRQKMLYNERADKEQFAAYKSRLGSDASRKFSDFQDMKYRDAEKYTELKQYYRYKKRVPEAKKDDFEIAKRIKEKGIVGTIRVPAAKIDISNLSAVNDHAFRHGCTIEDAKKYIKNAKVIHTHKQIGTVDFNDTNAIMRVLEHAKQDSNNLSYEICHIVTNDGKVWKVHGDSVSINLGNIPSSLMRSYSYHNHPSNKTWYSFSAEDVGMFMEYKQSYSKASDDIYEYIMRRTKDTVDLDYNSVYNMFKEIEKTDVMLMKWDGIIDPDTDGYHSVMEILSKRYHFEYERRKMND